MTDDSDSPPGKRQFGVSIQAMADLAREGSQLVVKEGMPQDAVCIDAGYDELRQVFYLTFKHDEWNPVAEGERIPTERVTIDPLPRE